MLISQSRWVNRAWGCAALSAATAILSSGVASARAPAEGVAAPAEAEAAPAEAPPAINLTGSPSIDLSTPKPGPPVAREFHQHEGFYLRLNAGLGTLLSANIDTLLGDVSSGGLTLNYDLLIGGSPAPGFTIGGGLLGGLQLSGDWELEGSPVSGSGDMTTLIIGPFADGYFDPKRGWHMGGLAGLARVAFDVGGSGDGSDALGFGGAFWTGYDAWVAPEWSIGGLLRLDALRATNSDEDLTVTEVGLTLMFSVLYN
jgi:hypothetical protein